MEERYEVTEISAVLLVFLAQASTPNHTHNQEKQEQRSGVYERGHLSYAELDVTRATLQCPVTGVSLQVFTDAARPCTLIEITGRYTWKPFPNAAWNAKPEVAQTF